MTRRGGLPMPKVRIPPRDDPYNVPNPPVGPVRLPVPNPPPVAPAPPVQAYEDDGDAVMAKGGRSRRRRHRTRKSRRRGGHSDLKTRRQGMVKAVLHEARERAKAEQRRQVMERVHKKGMEMLARRKTNSATSR